MTQMMDVSGDRDRKRCASTAFVVVAIFAALRLRLLERHSLEALQFLEK